MAIVAHDGLIAVCYGSHLLPKIRTGLRTLSTVDEPIALCLSRRAGNSVTFRPREM